MLVLDSNKTFLPFWMLYPIDLLFCGMLGCSMAIFTINFVYRYLVMKGRVSKKIVYIGPNYYPKEGVVDWIPILGMTILTLMIFASVYSIIYFAAKSYIAMNKLVLTSKNSERYRTNQIQLLNALVLQAIIPFVLMHFPASFVFIMPFFNCGNQTFARIFSVTVALYPVLDPLPTIFIVKCYRTAVTKIERENPSTTSYQCPPPPTIA
uniref:G_PROTEIN_RECEP_F1_2 domain-containing protein n=1 Tax=Caenorhabditis tropicalis TaxID=1561998 RepID=A0A1I7V0A6_9PELO